MLLNLADCRLLFGVYLFDFSTGGGKIIAKFVDHRVAHRGLDFKLLTQGRLTLNLGAQTFTFGCQLRLFVFKTCLLPFKLNDARSGTCRISLFSRLCRRDIPSGS
ncbi:MAG: hypothetical protein K2G00_08630 [Duncaniella sp.]|nr:hypothetical protein [Duncaniella sp.]